MIKRNIMFLCIAIILLAACSPSPQVIQTAIANTQEAMINVPVENAPKPAATALPTEQPGMIPTQETENKYDMILSDVADNLRSRIDNIDSVTTIKRGVDSLEVEIRIAKMSEDVQPNVAFEAIHLLATTFGNMSEEKALKFVSGNPQHFSILLITSSNDGDHRFSSLTSYDTLVKIINEQMSFIDWVSESNAHFLN